MTTKKSKSRRKKRPPNSHKPTPEQRGRVRGMAMANIPHDVIATDIGITAKTLRRAYREEIDKGYNTLLAGAATNMARMALGAKAEYDDVGHVIRAEVKPELGACCFVLKTQGKKFGWSERTEITGADGAPLFNDLDLSKLDPKEYAQLKGLLSKAGVDI